MSTKRPHVPAKPIRLSEVKFHPRHHAGACIVVEGKGYVGKVRLVGAELIGDVSIHHTRNSKPTHLALEESETAPGDVICIPTMKESPDYLKLEWEPKARTARVNLAKLLALKEITIPPGTNLVITLYYEDHPSYGPVIALKLNNPEFRSVRSKAKEAAPKDSK